MRIIVSARGLGKSTYANLIRQTEGTGCLHLVPFLPSDLQDLPNVCTYEDILEKYSNDIPVVGDSIICEEPDLANKAFHQVLLLSSIEKLPPVILVIGTPILKCSNSYFCKLAEVKGHIHWQHNSRNLWGTPSKDGATNE